MVKITKPGVPGNESPVNDSLNAQEETVKDSVNESKETKESPDKTPEAVPTNNQPVSNETPSNENEKEPIKDVPTDTPSKENEKAPIKDVPTDTPLSQENLAKVIQHLPGTTIEAAKANPLKTIKDAWFVFSRGKSFPGISFALSILTRE